MSSENGVILLGTESVDECVVVGGNVGEGSGDCGGVVGELILMRFLPLHSFCLREFFALLMTSSISCVMSVRLCFLKNFLAAMSNFAFFWRHSECIFDALIL